MAPHVVLVNLAWPPGLLARELPAKLPGLGRFAGALAGAGLRATVLARAGEDAAFEAGGARYVTVADGGPPFPPLRAALPEIAGAARALAPDVVHLGGLLFPLAVLALRSALPRKVPLVLQHHGEPPGGGRLGLAQRACLRAADAFLFTAGALADEWRRGGHLPPGAAVEEVLEASTDLGPVPRSSARERTGVDGSPAVLWVGRLHPRKDPVTAIRLFERALPGLPGARLHLVYGEETLLGEVRSIVSGSEALSRAVRFVGRVPNRELAHWYSAADLLLTSSPAEGSNWALIEASACGLPAVASAIPANRRVAGNLAEFFRAGDVPAGADALARAAGRARDEGESLRAALRTRFEESLSWDVVAAEAASAYAAAIGRRRP
jgi:glycosyltransferase involved in cell wall biosynthesis